MLDAIRDFFSSTMTPEDTRETEGTTAHPESEPDLKLAACALLLELAHADEEFTGEERQHVESAVRRHFGLDPDDAEQLLQLAEAERREAVDLWQFTNLVDESYSLGQKTLLAEVMWGLVYADGELAQKEAHLMRKISYLLHLKPGYLAEARKRVKRRREDLDVD
ncbi:MAG: TerB family tellurite resistance protein [Gemmatimonadota bacterium]|nr:TerB family tellurite resistance protein [Gemmatimonadota bacterium]